MALALFPPATANAKTLTADFVYPSDGAVGVDLSQPIQWTAVENVDAYYLYLGTSAGANNVVNSGEIQTTSYVAVNVPANQTLYARIYVKSGGVWRYSQITFTAAPLTTVISYPANGATNADLSQAIQWSPLPNVQAYYLYVGTSAGANNVVNSGEIQTTSYVAVNVPANQTLYARIYAKVGGVWRYTQSTFSAATVGAAIIYPLNGATNVDMRQPIQWTSVPNAQAYYLYVGTTAGANNVVNTGEIQATAQLVNNAPINQTLYARIYTKLGGVWRYTQITFSATLNPAVLTFPANGATNANLSQPIQWTTVAGAQAYYLYVGTSLGTNNVVNTGEIQTTSYLPASVPANQTLYARIYTKIGGAWRFTDSTFTATALAPTMTYPANGAANVDVNQPFRWTSVANAQAYYLYVGTSPGASDLVNSAELASPSYVVAAALPSNQTLHARVFAKVGNVWRSTSTTFTAAASFATLIYPANGATGVDQTRPFTWTYIAGAQSYTLDIGTTPGGRELVHSGEIQQTSYAAPGLPPNQTLYVTLHTFKGGIWRHVDSTFSALPLAPRFVYPRDGATGVDVARQFEWTASSGADAYRLIVGTARGANDAFDSGEIAATSVAPAGLPTSGVLYAAVWARVRGAWNRRSEMAFTAESSVAPSSITVPADGATGFRTRFAFEWQDVTLARGYRLTIGTTAGGTDLHDSGEIHVTRRFVPDLPTGVPLYGRVHTRIDGHWLTTDFGFSVRNNATSATQQINAALWATDFVRTMAAGDSRPFDGTPLATALGFQYFALCSDYASMLLTTLAEVNVPMPARVLQVALNANFYDVHTLVEMLNPRTNTWMILDPTFDLAASRNGVWATAEDLQQTTLAFDWAAISYTFLGQAGDAYARGYYIDFPLLFTNVYHEGQTAVRGQGNSPLPYMTQVTMPVADGLQNYAARCDTETTNLSIDGNVVQLACSGIVGLSPIFTATSVDTVLPNQPVDLFKLLRFVF